MKTVFKIICLWLFVLCSGSNLEAAPPSPEGKGSPPLSKNADKNVQPPKGALPSPKGKGSSPVSKSTDKNVQLPKAAPPKKKKPSEAIFVAKIRKDDPNGIVFVVRMPSGWTPEKDKEAREKGVKSVRGVLIICTWDKNPGALVGNVSIQRSKFGSLVRFADTNGLAVMTWSNFGGYQTKISSDEMGRKAARSSDAFFNERLAEWEYGIKRIVKRFNLPSDSYMGYGLSGGAQILHRMALRKPQYFSGIHVHVNSSYDIPTPKGKDVVWLVSTGEFELGCPAATRFYQKMVKMGYCAIFKVGEQIGHSSSREIDALSLEFFKYLLSFMPNSDNPEWTSPAPDKYHLIKDPPYIGDYLNQVSYPAKNAPGKIADEECMVPLPTEKMARAWGPVIK